MNPDGRGLQSCFRTQESGATLLRRLLARSASVSKSTLDSSALLLWWPVQSVLSRASSSRVFPGLGLPKTPYFSEANCIVKNFSKIFLQSILYE